MSILESPRKKGKINNLLANLFSGIDKPHQQMNRKSQTDSVIAFIILMVAYPDFALFRNIV